MDKKLLEEINKINFLNSYKVGKTLNEQSDLSSENLILEINEPKTKSFNLNLGGGRNQLRDITRGSLNIGGEFTYDKEVDEELTKPANVTQKMNAELSSFAEYNKLTGEQRIKLGEAFYNALNTILDDPRVYISKQTDKSQKKEIRKLKKFFKKAQRWKFVMNNEVLPEEYKSVDLSLIAEVEPEELTGLKTALQTALTNKFDYECEEDVVLSNSQSVYAGNNEDGTFNYVPVTKKPLSFIITTEEEEVKPAKLRDANVKETKASKMIEIPKIETNYDPGASDPKPFLESAMETIYNTLYSTKIDYEKPKGDSDSKTLKEMIECNRSGECDVSYRIEIYKVYSESSASNTWTGTDVLDVTHTNDDEFVKKIENIEKTGNNLKNAALAKKRGDLLVQSIVSKFKQNTDIIVSENIYDNVDMYYKVTDTGGKLDNDPTKTLPNPGQYANFTFYVRVTILGNIKISAESELTGKIANNVISLEYIGKQGGGFGFSSYSYTTGRMKAQYVDHSGASDWMSASKQRRRNKSNDRDYARRTGTIPAYKQNRKTYGRSYR
jgi:hypothetical protein